MDMATRTGENQLAHVRVTRGRFDVLPAVRIGVASDLRAEARRTLRSARCAGAAAARLEAPAPLTVEALRAFVGELVPFALCLPAGAEAAAHWIEGEGTAGFVFALRPHAGSELEAGDIGVSSRLVEASRLLPSGPGRPTVRECLLEVAAAVAAHLDALGAAYEALFSLR